MAVLQSQDEVARRLAKAHYVVGEPPTSSMPPPRKFALTTTVVDNLIGFIKNPSERWYLGFPEIDLATRGIGRGEVLLVLGRSHTGKSQILLNSIVTNIVNDPSAHVVIFSMDEPRELVVMKLFCLLHGRSSTEVEERIKDNDSDLLAELERAGREELSRVAVVDEVYGLPSMAEAMDEARTLWGCDPSFCMVDYLELLPGGESDASGVTS